MRGADSLIVTIEGNGVKTLKSSARETRLDEIVLVGEAEDCWFDPPMSRNLPVVGIGIEWNTAA